MLSTPKKNVNDVSAIEFKRHLGESIEQSRLILVSKITLHNVLIIYPHWLIHNGSQKRVNKSLNSKLKS